jgi:hypothetical protein
MSETLYELWHFHIAAAAARDLTRLMLTDDSTQVELAPKSIGTFSTERRAWEAARSLTAQPGFRDWPGGFRVLAVPIDVDFFPDGFDPDAH